MFRKASDADKYCLLFILTGKSGFRTGKLAFYNVIN